MLQRDYIQRLIREFMAALQRFLEKKEIGQRQEAMRLMYEKYLGDYAFFHTASLDDIMAELYTAEADLMSEPMRTAQLDMAYALFDFIDRHSRTYSPERLKKMKDINEKVKK